ncbi:hypothetical protein BS47DRAFT_1367901 [Hydnum rufescens UP504]|uniref:Uncharacterized protein n=1 Tax=Hydnum rufescens UP504 TaxID=1448309 RepID=A0A9P6AHI9_9AGAM|nr:hypothetical protein BS47DRAFT_1367901 [Hydnum rufescens UP504]
MDCVRFVEGPRPVLRRVVKKAEHSIASLLRFERKKNLLLVMSSTFCHLVLPHPETPIRPVAWNSSNSHGIWIGSSWIGQQLDQQQLDRQQLDATAGSQQLDWHSWIAQLISTAGLAAADCTAGSVAAGLAAAGSAVSGIAPPGKVERAEGDQEAFGESKNGDGWKREGDDHGKEAGDNCGKEGDDDHGKGATTIMEGERRRWSECEWRRKQGDELTREDEATNCLQLWKLNARSGGARQCHSVHSARRYSSRGVRHTLCLFWATWIMGTMRPYSAEASPAPATMSKGQPLKSGHDASTKFSPSSPVVVCLLAWGSRAGDSEAAVGEVLCHKAYMVQDPRHGECSAIMTVNLEDRPLKADAL